jgi:Fic family protein
VPPVYSSLEDKKQLEAQNGAKQFFLVLDQIEGWQADSRITPKLLCSLQHRAIVNIYSCAGNFRNGPVTVKDGDKVILEPPPWQSVPSLVDEMCGYVNDQWNDLTPIHVASYLMWRLNWIHPFFGGNGRTARSISYLGLCARLGFRLPGTVTIPDHIVNRRDEYIEALRDADRIWSTENRVDLHKMEALMESVMAAQMIELIEKATGKNVG